MNDIPWDELKFGEITIIQRGDKYQAIVEVCNVSVHGQVCEDIPKALEALLDRICERKAIWGRVKDKAKYLLDACNKEAENE